MPDNTKSFKSTIVNLSSVGTSGTCEIPNQDTDSFLGQCVKTDDWDWQYNVSLLQNFFFIAYALEISFIHGAHNRDLFYSLSTWYTVCLNSHWQFQNGACRQEGDRFFTGKCDHDLCSHDDGSVQDCSTDDSRYLAPVGSQNSRARVKWFSRYVARRPLLANSWSQTHTHRRLQLANSMLSDNRGTYVSRISTRTDIAPAANNNKQH